MFIIIRIIAGKNKGCRLRTKEGLTTRPTLDRIRENVFNIIRDRIPGSHVLDLFAGSGAIGLECLSRGAESAVFIEKDREAFGILEENVAKTRQEADYDVEMKKCDALSGDAQDKCEADVKTRFGK